MADVEHVELRDKEEITREIEQSRQEVKDALHLTQQSWTGPNPATRAWSASKAGVLRTKEVLVDKACATDLAIRRNIYGTLGMALGIGAAIGFLARLRSRRVRARSWC